MAVRFHTPSARLTPPGGGEVGGKVNTVPTQFIYRSPATHTVPPLTHPPRVCGGWSGMDGFANEEIKKTKQDQ